MCGGLHASPITITLSRLYTVLYCTVRSPTSRCVCLPLPLFVSFSSSLPLPLYISVFSPSISPTSPFLSCPLLPFLCFLQHLYITPSLLSSSSRSSGSRGSRGNSLSSAAPQLVRSFLQSVKEVRQLADRVDNWPALFGRRYCCLDVHACERK